MKVDSMDAQLANIVSKNESVAAGAVVKEKSLEAPEISVQQSDKAVNTSLSDVEKKEYTVAEKTIIEAIEKANKAIVGSNRKFEFSIHEKTKEIMIKVLDADTNEVVKEIPNEKILDAVAKMWEMSGVMLDKKG